MRHQESRRNASSTKKSSFVTDLLMLSRNTEQQGRFKKSVYWEGATNQDFLPTQLHEKKKEMFLFDRHTIIFLVLKNVMSIAEIRILRQYF
jgi:hypothetical protein